MQNVAAYAGVSIATVSKVMQGDPTVRPENVTAVQNAIEALGYRINPLAADLRRGRRKLIGAVLPSLEGVAGLLAAGLERQAEAHGYTLSLASSQGSEAREGELIGRFLDWRVAGLVVVPVRDGSEGPALMLGEGTAAVFVDRIAGAGRFDAIAPDYEGAARRVLDRFTRTQRPHVLVLTREDPALGAGGLATCLERLAGTGRVRLTSLSIGGDAVASASRLQDCLTGSDAPTGVVALWLPALTMVLGQAAANGQTIPSDLAVIGLQDADWLRPGTMPVDVIVYPVDKLADRAIAMLLQRLEQPLAPTLRVSEPMSVRFERPSERVRTAFG